MYLKVHRSTVYNSQDMEATLMSISRRMDKKAVVHLGGKWLQIAVKTRLFEGKFWVLMLWYFLRSHAYMHSLTENFFENYFF